MSHIRAFEYFGGVPRTVKLDNLKSGVLEANLYEPIIQADYAEMLAHYGSAPVACRPRRPQDKGKVESGMKYVQSNFMGRLRHRDFDNINEDLLAWLDGVGNRRRHGTTRRIPAEVFAKTEQPALLSLPQQRFEIWDSCERTVDRIRYDLLIIDVLGFRKLPEQSLDDILEIIRRRYETGSMIITTKRNFEDWQQILGDAAMASAVIDRILHHAHVVRITGERYRVKNYNAAAESPNKKTISKNT